MKRDVASAIPVAGQRASMKAFYFTAKWCGPCRTFKPQAKEILSMAGIEVFEVDIDDNEDMVSANKIMSVPTVIFASLQPEGWQETNRVVGASIPLLIKTLAEVQGA